MVVLAQVSSRNTRRRRRRSGSEPDPHAAERAERRAGTQKPFESCLVEGILKQCAVTFVLFVEQVLKANEDIKASGFVGQLGVADKIRVELFCVRWIRRRAGTGRPHRCRQS